MIIILDRIPKSHWRWPLLYLFSLGIHFLQEIQIFWSYLWLNFELLNDDYSSYSQYQDWIKSTCVMKWVYFYDKNGLIQDSVSVRAFILHIRVSAYGIDKTAPWWSGRDISSSGSLRHELSKNPR